MNDIQPINPDDTAAGLALEISNPVPSDQVPATVLHDAEQFDGEQDITVIARYPYQMEKAQASLIEWATRKVAATELETADLWENIEIAKKNNWGTGGLHRAWKRSEKMVEFYQKILAALQSGYCIVPNFPVQMFAIRTKKRIPVKGETGSWSDTHEQKAEGLPAGEGEYKNPLPVIHRRDIGEDDKGNKMRTYFAHHFAELDFPFALAKPEILSATSRAMSDKLFDDIGCLPGKKKKEDPIVVGRIKDPRSTQYDQRFVTFLIAWFLDTRTL